MKETNYCILTIDWNDENNTSKFLFQLTYPKPSNVSLPPSPQSHATYPKKWTVPVYGQSTQYEKVPYKNPPLDEKVTKYIQTNADSLFHYSKAVYPTMLPALNEIAAIQAKSNLHKKLATDLLLDYYHTYPNSKIR